MNSGDKEMNAIQILKDARSRTYEHENYIISDMAWSILSNAKWYLEDTGQHEMENHHVFEVD